MRKILLTIAAVVVMASLGWADDAQPPAKSATEVKDVIVAKPAPAQDEKLTTDQMREMEALHEQYPNLTREQLHNDVVNYPERVMYDLTHKGNNQGNGSNGQDLRTDLKDRRTDVKDLGKDKIDRRKDRRELRTDLRDRNGDVRELRKDVRDGASQQEIHSDRKDVRADTYDIRQDRKDIHRDKQNIKTDRAVHRASRGK